MVAGFHLRLRGYESLSRHTRIAFGTQAETPNLWVSSSQKLSITRDGHDGISGVC